DDAGSDGHHRRTSRARRSEEAEARSCSESRANDTERTVGERDDRANHDSARLHNTHIDAAPAGTGTCPGPRVA
ncbi:MAG TPA: hypothetical protein VLC09_14310, partial [Polyangiaceae bacterium]|nr:hypothetical protein [Polyangiaceae bacterium]